MSELLIFALCISIAAIVVVYVLAKFVLFRSELRQIRESKAEIEMLLRRRRDFFSECPDAAGEYCLDKPVRFFYGEPDAE